MIPTVLEDGIPLIVERGPGVEMMRVVKHRMLSNGMVQVHYEPARAGRG